MVDDSHATGFVGKTGRGTASSTAAVMDRVDVYTSHARQGARRRVGRLHQRQARDHRSAAQRSRPYLFSNTLAPPIVAGSLAAIALLSESTELRDKLERNTARFRAGMTAAGLNIRPGTHPITPVMLGDARLANQMAARLLELGIYVIGFSFPVVPKGAARIRVQLSAAHSEDDVDRAVAAFAQVGKELGVV
jgi:glycine C-acetyltransferase